MRIEEFINLPIISEETFNAIDRYGWEQKEILMQSLCVSVQEQGWVSY